MDRKTKNLENKIESMRSQLKHTYANQKNKSLVDQDVYHLSTKLDTLIARYMKSHCN